MGQLKMIGWRGLPRHGRAAEIPLVVTPWNLQSKGGFPMSFRQIHDPCSYRHFAREPQRIFCKTGAGLRISLLAGCALAAVTLAVTAATPALAGCNSGDINNPHMLTSDSCRSYAPGAGATAVGHFSSAAGDNAVALGESAGTDYTIPGAVSVGAYAGHGVAGPAGWYSTAIGSGTAYSTAPFASGAYSIAIGGGDGDAGGGDGAVSEGSHAIAIGAATNAPGDGSIAIGWAAYGPGHYSTAVGPSAGYSASGSSNSAFGVQAGQYTSGDRNTAVGSGAGYTVNGNYNAALGDFAGGTVTGHFNTAAGINAGGVVQGSSNAAYGDGAGANVTGDHNVGVGREAGAHVSGNANVAIGWNAGANISAASSVSIGANAVGRELGAVAIGQSALATKARSVAIGSSSVATVANTVSVGSGSLRRRIMNVAPAVADNDAVTLAQLNAAVAAMAANSHVAPTAAPDNASIIEQLRREVMELRAEMKQLRQMALSQVSAARPE
jgi:hypothetical protein